jgi:hypothetical protein
MANLRGFGCWLIAAAGFSGCTSGPDMANPLPAPSPFHEGATPLFIAQGHRSGGYENVFRAVSDVVSEYYRIAESNRFAGQIVSEPKLSGGYLTPWDRVPSGYERDEATFQTIRRTCIVKIQPAQGNGFEVDVQVLKELEDLPRPVHASAGLAIIGYDAPIARQFELVRPEMISNQWIPIGRDYAQEQMILSELKRRL